MEARRKSEIGIWLCAFALGVLALLAQANALLGRSHAAAARVEELERVATAEKYVVPSSRASLNTRRVADTLVDSIIQVESAGNPSRVGRAGERGLMQIKRATWNDVAPSVYGRRVSFDLAFDPAYNRRVGKMYLAHIQGFLHRHRDAWKADERMLLLACYNAGPRRVQQAGFDLGALPRSTRSYVERAAALHDHFLADQARELQRLLISQASVAPAMISGS